MGMYIAPNPLPQNGQSSRIFSVFSGLSARNLHVKEKKHNSWETSVKESLNSNYYGNIHGNYTMDAVCKKANGLSESSQIKYFNPQQFWNGFVSKCFFVQIAFCIKMPQRKQFRTSSLVQIPHVLEWDTEEMHTERASFSAWLWFAHDACVPSSLKEWVLFWLLLCGWKCLSCCIMKTFISQFWVMLLLRN